MFLIRVNFQRLVPKITMRLFSNKSFFDDYCWNSIHYIQLNLIQYYDILQVRLMRPLAQNLRAVAFYTPEEWGNQSKSKLQFMS